MPYNAEYTPHLIAALQRNSGEEFTASELKKRTTVPKKYVRRALTVDAEKVAEIPRDGVTMVQKGGLWRYSWTGRAIDPTPQKSH